MKNGFMLFVACAITIAVAVSKDNKKESNPSASLSPAMYFGDSTPRPKPNTTTAHPKPNTTTAHPKPNTTTAHPNATTAYPNATTAHPTLPPPKPTPKANLTGGDYALHCAMVSMELQIKVEYEAQNKNEGTYIVQPNKATVIGECKNNTVNFNITFKEGFIDFQFQKNNTDKSIYVTSIAVELTYPFDHADPTTKYRGSNSSVHLFRAAVGHSYSCRNQSLYLGNGLHLEMTKGRMQAFNTTKSFGPPDPCPADKPDYRVAIAVGIVLLILIVIVVVAYIIGRRKRTDGYQSL